MNSRIARTFRSLGLPLLVALASGPLSSSLAEDRPNVLLITVDDMNCDSVGAFGCVVPGTTPHIDRLAEQGMRFARAHVNVAICQPTRAVWMTGRYPHNNGALGFDQIKQGVPTLVEALKDAGYATGLLGKVGHVVPSRRAAWDLAIDAPELGQGRDPSAYREQAAGFIASAQESGRPFFLMANTHDPHRPFAGSDQETRRFRPQAATKKQQRQRQTARYPDPARIFSPEEIEVPGFLPDLPEVRREIAEYYSSVHRADQVVGEVLDALNKSGAEGKTLVLFLSDHGMPLPFAKTNCYLHSTRTPWIVRWPGKVEPGSLDLEHMISGIDLAPTILDALGLPNLEGADGRSFLPVLLGDSQEGREGVFTHINTVASGRAYPMRSVVGRRFGYIFNPWSNGETVFRNESQSGRTMNAMNEAAGEDPEIAARVQFFLHRVPEEFYDYENDPDALHNLIDAPDYREEIKAAQGRMRELMEATNDPQLKAYDQHLESIRGSPALLMTKPPS